MLGITGMLCITLVTVNAILRSSEIKDFGSRNQRFTEQSANIKGITICRHLFCSNNDPKRHDKQQLLPKAAELLIAVAKASQTAFQSTEVGWNMSPRVSKHCEC